MTPIRWHVACINWTHPDAPHALVYSMRGSELVTSRYFSTWRKAMDWVSR